MVTSSAALQGLRCFLYILLIAPNEKLPEIIVPYIFYLMLESRTRSDAILLVQHFFKKESHQHKA
jgi:hypothetical protein